MSDRRTQIYKVLLGCSFLSETVRTKNLIVNKENLNWQKSQMQNKGLGRTLGILGVMKPWKIIEVCVCLQCIFQNPFKYSQVMILTNSSKSIVPEPSRSI